MGRPYFKALEESLPNVRYRVTEKRAVLVGIVSPKGEPFPVRIVVHIPDEVPARKDMLVVLSTLNRQMIPMMHAKRFLMAELEREATDAVQTVVLTGPKNHEWLARFKVERQPDGSWRVKSCHMELAKGQRI